jgi:D-3-phosphoglycerate dehydrogenase
MTQHVTTKVLRLRGLKIMPKVLVSDDIAREGVEILERVAQVDVETGLREQELVERIGDYDALVVRSQTPVTRRVIEAGARLKIVGRAGVGVDNVDVAAATERGVIVVNSPAGNTVAVAELTLGLMIALVRRIPAADVHVRSQEWKRSQFMGKQLYGKTLGIIGLGKIGTEVAKRAATMGMDLIGFDPFITQERAQELGIELMDDVSDVFQQADFLTLHVPVTRDTRRLVNRQTMEMMKDGVYVLNLSRGEIVDEAALAEALESGKVAGAALDVFEREPPTDSPLLKFDNVIVTPHIGASTEEAQTQVAVEVAQQIADVLQGRSPRNAVNIPGIPPELRERLEPYMRLAEKLGVLQAQFAEGRIERVELSYAGDLAEFDTQPLKRAFLRGLMQPFMREAVNDVNAPLIAEQRGIRVSEHKTSAHEDYTNLIATKVATTASQSEMAGTVFGKSEPRIISLHGYHIDIVPEGYILFVHNYDVPGMIGKVGTILGNAGVNIAGMQVGRIAIGGKAVMALSVDSSVTEEVVQEILQASDGIIAVKQVDFELRQRNG